MKMTKHRHRFTRVSSEEGVGSAEYSTVLGFLVIAAVAVVSAQGEKMRALYGTSGNALAGGAGAEETRCADGSCSCFVAGTPVDTAEGPKAIDAVTLGDRVGPESAECRDFRTDGWREVGLRLTVAGDVPGDSDLQIQLLRPPEWLAEHSVGLGNRLAVSLEEMNLRGEALVTSVGEGRPLEAGFGAP